MCVCVRACACYKIQISDIPLPRDHHLSIKDILPMIYYLYM